MSAIAKLTNLQLELLQTFSYALPDQQLIEIRQLLAQYFLDKVDEEMDNLWQVKGWTVNTIEEWAKEHERTPYQSQS